MSSTAPWLALAVDFDESEMWDALPQYGIEKESTMGERLAWVCLLCEAKKKGRGGKVSIRKTKFISDHRLSGRSVDGMLIRAQKCGAIAVNGDLVTLCNWPVYQEKRGGKRGHESPESPESALPITHHPSPITKPQPQSPLQPRDSGDAELEPLNESWSVVVVSLEDEGMGRAEEACRIARENGNHVGEVTALLEQWKVLQPPLVIGALYKQICQLRPGRKSGWAPPREPSTYRQVTAAEFREAVTLKKFKDGPTRHASDPKWVFGTLRTNEKIECRDFPVKKAN